MAKVPLPERGQPLDVTYIYQLAETVNDLATQVSSATYNYTTIDNGTSGPQSVKTSETKIIGGYVSVVNNATVTASSEASFSFAFDYFKYSPIVSATPYNIGGTPAGQNVSIILKTVTTSKVEGTVRFNASGDLTLAVHLVIIGIPN